MDFHTVADGPLPSTTWNNWRKRKSWKFYPEWYKALHIYDKQLGFDSREICPGVLSKKYKGDGLFISLIEVFARSETQ